MRLRAGCQTRVGSEAVPQPPGPATDCAPRCGWQGLKAILGPGKWRKGPGLVGADAQGTSHVGP